MARAHLYRPITDRAGNVRLGATVRLLQPGTVDLITETIYSSDTGTATLANPFTADDGVVNIYLAAPRRVDVSVQYGTDAPVVFRDIDVLLPFDEGGAAVDHTHPAHPDTDHDDRFALLGHTHTGLEPGPHTHATVLRVATASETLGAADQAVFFNGTDLTATLPTAVGVAGKQYIVKNINASPLTIASAGGVIDGDTTRVLAQYDTLTVLSDGTNWGVI